MIGSFTQADHRVRGNREPDILDLLGIPESLFTLFIYGCCSFLFLFFKNLKSLDLNPTIADWDQSG